MGAGKTTLLNHMVRDPEAGRIALIINEYGDVGLDHDPLEDALLLQSGCLCCSIRGDLIEAMGKLIAQRDSGALEVDRVVIETTGIADPGPILHSLTVDRRLSARVRLDGVLAVADAVTGLRTLERQSEAVHQIAVADVIVLSKTDRASPQDIAQIEARLRALNTTAPVIRAAHGAVPVGTLFGRSALQADAAPKQMLTWLGASEAPQPGASAAPITPKPVLMPDAEASSSGHQISSASIVVEQPICADVFDIWLDTLIALKGPDILRIKRIVHVEGMSWPFVFHGVQHIFDAPVPLKS